MNADSAIAYQFCVDHALLPYLRQSIELAQSVFDVAGDVRLHKESDPEAGEEYVVIDIPVRGTPEQLFEAYRKHTRLTRPFPDEARARLRLMVDPV